MGTGTRQPDGSLVLVSTVGPPQERGGFENLLLPGVEVGLAGWERAHSQGPGTGVESAEGIVYAPREVNQEDQNRGVEKFIRELFKEKAADVDLRLTTVTRCHTGTRRLRSIEYKVEAVRAGVSTVVLEAALEVENKRSNPKVSRSVTPRALVEPFLRTTDKDTLAQRLLFDAIDRIQAQLNLLAGEHQAEERILTNTNTVGGFAVGMAGFVTNKFNKFPFPPQSIWLQTAASLSAARGAFRRQDFAQATKQVFAAGKHLAVATKRYTLWKDGLDAAAARTKQVIAAVAIAIPVAIAAPTVARTIFAWVVRGAQTARLAQAATGATAASTRVDVGATAARIRVAVERFDVRVAAAATDAELMALQAEADQLAEQVGELSELLLRSPPPLGP